MIEKHVPSLELCKELKRLGFPQDTEFYWDDLGHRFTIEYAPKSNTKRFICAAPLVSEMAEWVVGNSKMDMDFSFPMFSTSTKGWIVREISQVLRGNQGFLPLLKSMPNAYATQCIEILKAKEKP